MSDGEDVPFVFWRSSRPKRRRLRASGSSVPLLSSADFIDPVANEAKAAATAIGTGSSWIK